MSSLYARGNALIPVTGVDLSAALGKAVKFTAGVPAVNDSATVPAKGVVLEAAAADGVSTIGILGGLTAPVRVKIAGDSADLKLGDGIMQKSDGTFTLDTGADPRCFAGVITDPNGAVAGDLAEAQLVAPQIRS